MGQNWEMIAHDRLETLGIWGKVAEWLSTPLPIEIIPRLVVPVDVDIGSSSAYAGLTVARNVDSGNHLLDLPTEVFCLITAELDLNSLYTLSQCSYGLRIQLRPEVHDRFRRILAPWANTPLICAGEYMTSNPPGIETQVPEGLTLDDPEVEDENGFVKKYPSSVYDLMLNLGSTNIALQASFSPPTLNPIRHMPTIPPYLPFVQGYRFWERILKLKQYFPPGRRWVLRNLTQKEYVYAYVLSSSDGYGTGGIDRPDGTHELGFNLGTVVAVNTCWSSEYATSVQALDSPISWAGHCFDIVVEDKLNEAMEGDEEWADVSRREWKEMTMLFWENDWHFHQDSDQEGSDLESEYEY